MEEDVYVVEKGERRNEIRMVRVYFSYVCRMYAGISFPHKFSRQRDEKNWKLDVPMCILYSMIHFIELGLRHILQLIHGRLLLKYGAFLK